MLGASYNSKYEARLLQQSLKVRMSDGKMASNNKVSSPIRKLHQMKEPKGISLHIPVKSNLNGLPFGFIQAHGLVVSGPGLVLFQREGK